MLPQLKRTQLCSVCSLSPIEVGSELLWIAQFSIFSYLILIISFLILNKPEETEHYKNVQIALALLKCDKV